MTGNTLTMNPAATNAYGTPQQGFWGNTGGFGGNTPFGFGTQAYQPQVTNPINPIGGFIPQLVPQMIQQPGFGGLLNQQPGFVGQPTSPWQTGLINHPLAGQQGTQNGSLQTTPPEVLNTILQTTPPQVLPYILNALACQQACQQVLAQNPQALQAINPQTITQPFLGTLATNQARFGFGVNNPGGFGVNTMPFAGGFQPQLVPQYQQQGSCVGCLPGQQGLSNVGFQGGFGQVVPQQPWINSTYGTW